jgi:hypothetical protein
MAESNTGMVQVDGVALGKLIGRFESYDDLIVALDRWA